MSDSQKPTHRKIRVYRYDRQGFAQPHGFLNLDQHYDTADATFRVGGWIAVGAPPIRFEVLLFWDSAGTHVGLVPIQPYSAAQLEELLGLMPA